MTRTLLLTSVLVWGSAAVQASTSLPTPGDRRVDALRVAKAPVIDGLLSESVWHRGEPSHGFWQREPHENEPASFSTEFRVAYDENALFVGVRAYDPQPQAIRGLLTRRDERSPSDWIAVSIDSLHDKRTAFFFAVNPAGVQRDMAMYQDGDVRDHRWSGVWEGSSRVDEQGWTAEMRIPFGQLRYPETPEQQWGFQVMRIVARTQEVSHWSPSPKSVSGLVSRFGTLHGLRAPNGTGASEWLPYAVAGGAYEPKYDQGYRAIGNVGLDMRYAVTTNVTLAATLNPDFGQVEADPSDVNLTAQETFLPEKRPFFLEGADQFRLRLSQGDDDHAVEELFYTRRIGALPHAEADDDMVRAPQTTTIYGAAKLSGKTSSGWSMGALSAMTGEESVRIPEQDGGSREQVLEPLTSYTVLSLGRDFREGRSSVSGLVTGIYRHLDGTDLSWLHRHAVTGGVQARHKFADDGWLAELKLLGSSVHGKPEAIDETQQASQRYYQRPDAAHLDYDAQRTSLQGFGAQYLVARIAGETLRGAMGGDTRSPGLEVNDLGFQVQADYATQWIWLQLRDDDPGTLVLERSLNFDAGSGWDYGGRHLFSGGNVNGNLRFANHWRLSSGAGYVDNHWHTDALRGGPAMRGTPETMAWLKLRSDPRRKLRGRFGASAAKPLQGGAWRARLYANLTLQAMSNFSVTLEPFWHAILDDLQYVDTPVDESGVDHYVLGRLHRHTLGATLRVGLALSPTLSLQLYAQPYFSTGRYAHYKESDRPGARRYERRTRRIDDGRITKTGDLWTVGQGQADQFSFSPADFNFRQLRSTLVMRWEYLPGSTLFVVWSHDRTSEGSHGSFNFVRDARALGREPGEHVVLVKLAYWLSM